MVIAKTGGHLQAFINQLTIYNMNAKNSQDAKAKLEADAKAKETKAEQEAADDETKKAADEAAKLEAETKAADEAAEKAADEAKKSDTKESKENAKDMSDRAVQARKAQKSASQTKKAAKKYAARKKAEDALAGTPDDPKKKQFLRVPTDYRDVVLGETYEFKAHHGRVKFEGELYEPEETFKTVATKELIGLVKEGILEIKSLRG